MVACFFFSPLAGCPLHCPKNILNFCTRTKLVKDGANITVYSICIWFLCLCVLHNAHTPFFYRCIHFSRLRKAQFFYVEITNIFGTVYSCSRPLYVIALLSMFVVKNCRQMPKAKNIFTHFENSVPNSKLCSKFKTLFQIQKICSKFKRWLAYSR